MNKLRNVQNVLTKSEIKAVMTKSDGLIQFYSDEMWLISWPKQKWLSNLYLIHAFSLTQKVIDLRDFQVQLLQGDEWNGEEDLSEIIVR